MGCQLNVHRGRADEHDPASSSSVPHPVTGKLPRVLSVAEIKKLIEDFGSGAKRVKAAGFDCVMIHGTSGYLISEFLSPRINQRTDEYGGDLKGRGRFALELVQETRRSVGPDYPIIFRLTADERVEKGWGLEEAVEFCKMLEEAGVNAIDLTTGSREAEEWNTPSMYMPPCCNVTHSEAIRKAVKIPVMVAGKINNLHLAEEVLRKGQADFVDIGRPFIADPEFLRKALEGRIKDIRVCIGCIKCSDAVSKSIPTRCSVNPAMGREKEFQSILKPGTRKKKVLVIGGGPAGMQAAIISAQKGHKVTLWEAGNTLGGELKLAALPPGKTILNNLLEYMETQLLKLGVVVELGKRATPKMVNEFAPDAVLVAVGSLPFTPDIPGIEAQNVVGYRQVLLRQRKLGKKVVVMGGGLVGCETAIFLAEGGKEVTVEFIEPEPVIPTKRIKATILKMLTERNVKVMPGVQSHKEITNKGIRVVDKEGVEQFLEGDNIVLATGAQANKTLAQSLAGNIPEVYPIGDCSEMGEILGAIHSGAETALKI
jgi:2,4-dienoyl-CoA reductase-like NADH-dependent reductase (Old Yellow Enzyme family)/thioredoxin reductase